MINISNCNVETKFIQLGLYVLLSFCFSCNDESTDSIIVKVDNAKINTLELEDIIDEISFIRLGKQDNQALVIQEYIDRFYAVDNLFVLYHRIIGDYGDVSVKIFNDKGKFIRSIPIPQDGPSSYKVVKDIWTDGQRLELLDYGASTIWQLDLKGNKQGRVPLNFTFDKFYKVEDHIYAFDLDQSPNELVQTNNLALCNTESGVILVDQNVPIPQFLQGIGIQGSRFTKDIKSNQLYFYPTVGTEVYKVSKKGIELYKEFDFSSGEFDVDANATIDTDQFLELRRKQLYVTSFDRLFKFGNKGIAQYRNNGNFYWILIDFKKGETKCIKPSFPIVDQIKISYQPSAVNQNGDLIFVIAADDIVSYYYGLGESKSDDKIYQKIGELALEDNPVLLNIPLETLFEQI